MFRTLAFFFYQGYSFLVENVKHAHGKQYKGKGRGERKNKEKNYWCLGQLGGLPWWPKESVCNPGDLGPIPGSGRFPKEEMATPSRILTWRIP